MDSYQRTVGSFAHFRQFSVMPLGRASEPAVSGGRISADARTPFRAGRHVPLNSKLDQWSRSVTIAARQLATA